MVNYKMKFIINKIFNISIFVNSFIIIIFEEYFFFFVYFII